MQRELLAVALRDHAGAVGVSELVVTAFAGDDALVKVFRVKDHLDKIPDAPASFQSNAQLLADGGGAAVGAGEVKAAERFGRAVCRAGVNRYAAAVLGELRQFETVSDSDVRRCLGQFLQQWLELVLRNELVRFQ